MQIAPTAELPRDEEIEHLLHEVYVGGGFTEPHVAAELFTGIAVRARGRLLTVRDGDAALAGMIVVVLPDSPARRLATGEEAELHLLAVVPRSRATGLGRALVEAALANVRACGLSRVVLWTQPSMKAAHRLYARCGFEREPVRDFVRGGQAFWVFTAKVHDV